MHSTEFYRVFFSTIWVSWFITWWVFAISVKVTVRRQSTLPRMLNMTLLTCAFVLLFWRRFIPVPGLEWNFLPFSQRQLWTAVGALLTLTGLLFTVWARVYIGRNWSGMFATIKADHELVTEGPYALVRHPIYFGLMLAFVGTALAIGQWRAVLATVLALIAIVHRIIVEEDFMREQFGATYDSYAKCVCAFVPFVL